MIDAEAIAPRGRQLLQAAPENADAALAGHDDAADQCQQSAFAAAAGAADKDMFARRHREFIDGQRRRSVAGPGERNVAQGDGGVGHRVVLMAN